MLVVTTENVAGYTVKEVKGPVFGLVVRSRGLGGTIAGGFKSLFGGEVTQFTSLLEDARKDSMDRLVNNAHAMGANAVIMMRFDSSELGSTMSEIVAYGTAVIIEKV